MNSRGIAKECGFKTAKDCLAALREVLHAAPLDTPLNGSGGDLLAAVYAHHPRFAPWDPPDQFTVTINVAEGFGPGTRGFVAWFAAGKPPHHFSYRFDQWGKFDPKHAARMAIYLRHGGGTEGHELHHEPPWTFAAIIEAWLEDLRRPPRYANIVAGSRFEPADEAAFLAFHDARATLRGIPVAEHIQIHHPRLTWLEGPKAVATAHAILATSGVVAVDFETFPTTPAWHGEQAARRAPRGRQAQARERAVREARLHVRAHKRRACTLQLRHEDGSELFARLLDPARELPAMFEGRVATLVSHNAQFESEVLLRHGVGVSIECTMIAAKCLHLVAVPEDAPQPVRFGLADLVAKEFGRERDKSVRDRDWREPPDAEAVAYGLQDVRDALSLWQLYEPRLRKAGLWDGYRVMARSLLPTAALNVEGGLVLDADAHATLMSELKDQAAALKLELGRACMGAIENHGSTAQVSAWVVEEVTGVPVKPPTAPRNVGLKEFLRRHGGVRPDTGGELRSRDLPKSLVRPDGMSLWDATIAAWEAGYIGVGMSTFGDEQPTEDDLLEALDQERFGHKVLPLEDDMAASGHEAAVADFEHRRGDLEMRDVMAKLAIRLHARTNGAVKGWRMTKTGCLAITKGSKLRKAEQLAEAFPAVSGYLVRHAQWTAKTKLLDGFGPTLRRWMDDDGTVRGQHRVFGAWTGRQSCADPNLQNQPHDEVFRALWRAASGRKLVIADYSQIELRLLAIEARDERLMEVYREGRDVHQETADIARIDRKSGKSCNFALAYGSGAAGLSENFGFELEESRRILAAVLGAYPGLADYRQRAPQVAAAAGFIAIRPGRRVEYNARSPGTTAINAPIQGGAASVQNLALTHVHAELRGRPWIDAKLAAAIHDEIILDAAAEDAGDAAAILVDCMTRALVEIYPEAEDMGLARLTAAAVVDTWAQKP